LALVARFAGLSSPIADAVLLAQHHCAYELSCTQPVIEPSESVHVQNVHRRQEFNGSEVFTATGAEAWYEFATPAISRRRPRRFARQQRRFVTQPNMRAGINLARGKKFQTAEFPMCLFGEMLAGQLGKAVAIDEARPSANAEYLR